MIGKLLEHLRSQRGQTLIEFVIVMPLVLAFLFTIVDFGIAIDRRITLQHAVREGARQAAVTTDLNGIVDTTVAQSQGLLDPADITVCYQDANGDGTVGDTGDNVKVSASFTYNFTGAFNDVFGAFGAPVSTGIDMTPSADMRLENAFFGAPPC